MFNWSTRRKEIEEEATADEITAKESPQTNKNINQPAKSSVNPKQDNRISYLDTC